jgi:hypothetical protein
MCAVGSELCCVEPYRDVYDIIKGFQCSSVYVLSNSIEHSPQSERVVG